MTPYDLSIALQGYIENKKREQEEFSFKYKLEHDEKVTQAYLISRWVWAKKVNLNDFLIVKQKKTMTEDELYKQGLAMVKMFGGDIQKTTD